MSVEQDQGANTPDLSVQWRTFAGLSVFIAVLGAVYWFASYDYAGTVMLGLASALSLVSAAYLWWQDRHGGNASASVEGDREAQYLPHASPWPFGVGLGAYLTFNGLVLGTGYVAPGVIVIGVSIVGLVTQSRRRD